MAITSPMPIPIPNTVFAFLNMYSTSNLEEAFEKMREEFVQERKTIIDWESRVRKTNKAGYCEALKVKNEIEVSLAALKKPDWGEIMSTVSPGIAINIIGGMVGPSTTNIAISEGTKFYWKLDSLC